MFACIDSKSGAQILIAHIRQVVSYRSQVGRTLKLAFKPIDIIIHTKRRIDIERSEELGIYMRVVALKTAHKLGAGNELNSVIPLL